MFSLLAATMLTCATATAQTITWQPVRTSTTSSDVSDNGTLMVARNLHAGATPVDATVNGVTFVGGFVPSGWTGTVPGGLAGSTTGNAGYDDLLNGSRACNTITPGNPSDWGAIRIDNLAAFTPGERYEIQCFFTDQRLGSTLLYDRVMTLSSAFGDATTIGGRITNLGSMLQGPLSNELEADPDNRPANPGFDQSFGSHCTGTFCYSPVGETWLIIRGSHPGSFNLRPHLTAFQIREVSKNTITWGPVMDSTDPSDVTQTGTTVVAHNFGESPVSPSIVVNGVTFSPVDPAGWNDSVFTNVNGSIHPAYDDLIDRAASPDSNLVGGVGGIRLSDYPLVTGRRYAIQIWFCNEDFGDNDDQIVLGSVADAMATADGLFLPLANSIDGEQSGVLDADPDNTPAFSTAGSHCTGTFLYDATAGVVLTVDMIQSGAFGTKPQINAMHIYELESPEFTTSGTGCASVLGGIPELTEVAPASIGQHLIVSMNNQSPAGVPLMIVGFTTIPAFPIMSIGLSQNPACLLTVNLDVLLGPLPKLPNGDAVMFLPIPNDIGLVGTTLFFQETQMELSPAIDWTLSDQGDATIGF